MVGLSEAIATLMLIVPGFVASGTMTFIMGLRRREWGSSVVWSLVFSIAIYGLLFAILPEFSERFDILTSINDSLQVVSGTDSSSNVRLLDAIRVASAALIVGIPFGFALGWLQKTKQVKNALARFTGHSYHLDVWGDFIENLQPHAFLQVFLKDGNSILGKFVSASDTHIGADKGVVLGDPRFYYKFMENKFTNKEAQEEILRGSVIIYFEQIAYVVELNHSLHKQSRYRKMVKFFTGRKWIILILIFAINIIAI